VVVVSLDIDGTAESQAHTSYSTSLAISLHDQVIVHSRKRKKLSDVAIRNGKGIIADK
jgi:hypothetical protein